MLISFPLIYYSLILQHVETFNNTNIGTMASELVVPPSLLGEWRMFLEVLTIRSEEKKNECLQANFQLEDI